MGIDKSLVCDLCGKREEEPLIGWRIFWMMESDVELINDYSVIEATLDGKLKDWDSSPFLLCPECAKKSCPSDLDHFLND